MSTDSTKTLVLESLVAHGAPLAGWSATSSPLSVEETLVRALEVSRSNATIFRVLPMVLARHASTVQLDSLAKEAQRHGTEAALGLLLGLTVQLHPNLPGRERLGRLEGTLSLSQSVRPPTFFFESDERNPHAQRLARLRTPPVALHWGFFMNMPEEAFKVAL